jgi:hypothetical protein
MPSGRSTSLTIEVLTDASKARAGLDQVAGGVDSLAGKLTGKLAGLALGAGILKFGTDSVKAAAQAEQAVGGVAAVFKGQSSQIETAAKGAAKSIGLSTSAYENLATVLGSQLKTAGFSDFAKKTQELITLGGDLAAMYGGTTKDAVESISSLMRGERDPIEKYGVSMNQAAIDAEVLALGLDTSTASAKKQAQAQASLSILYKQTADASGAAAREQDSASARYQQLTATLENMEAAVGSALLPAMSALAETAMELAPAIQAVGEAAAGALAFVLDLPAPVLATATAFGALVLLRGPISTFTTGVSEFFAMVSTQRAAAFDLGLEVGQLGATVATAGSKVAGFGKAALAAVGGPWGIAIAAGIGLATFALTAWITASQRAREIAENGKNAIAAYAGAIGKTDIGKLGFEAANAAAKAALETAKWGRESEDLNATYQTFGISQQLVLDAVNGVAGAREQALGAMDSEIAKHQAIVTAMEEQQRLASGTSGSGVAPVNQAELDAEREHLRVMQEQRTAIEPLLQTQQQLAEQRAKDEELTRQYTVTLTDQQRKMMLVAQAQEVWATAIKNGQAAAKEAAENTELAGVLDDASRKASAAGRALDYFQTSLDKVNGHSRTFVETQKDLGSTMSRFSDLFDTSGDNASDWGAAVQVGAAALTNFDVASLSATEAGRDVVDTVLAMKDAHIKNYSAAYSDALVTSTAATESGKLADAQTAAKDAARANYQALYDQVFAFTKNDEATRNLLKSMGILNDTDLDDHQFEIIAEDAAAQQAMLDMQNQKILDKRFDVIATDLASQGITKIQDMKIDPKTGIVSVKIGENQWVDYKPGEKTGTVKVNAVPGNNLMNNLLSGNFSAILGLNTTAAPTAGGFVVPTGRGFAVPAAGLATQEGAALGVQPLGDPTLTLPVAAVPVGSSRAQVVNVTYNLTVNGALDADATARQINSLLRSRDRRALAVTARRGMSI